MTATDTTEGLSSPAAPINVIVGSCGADTINVATLVGAAQAATPTFIYGLVGSDSIDASGMTGAIWIDASGGADVLTCGSGANDYLFGAAGDSSNSIITNFNAAGDLIDLTGLGTKRVCWCDLGHDARCAERRLAAEWRQHVHLCRQHDVEPGAWFNL